MNTRIRNILTGLGVVVGFLLVVLVGVLPLARRFLDLRVEVAQNRERIAELTERESRLQKFLRDKDEVAALADRARGYLPEEAATSRYIRELEGMAAATKAAVSSATFQPERKEKSVELSTVPVALSADGDFGAIAGFLAALEHDVRFSSFESVQLAALQGGAVSARLEGVLFTKPPKKLSTDLSALAIDPKIRKKLEELTQYATPFDAGEINAPGRGNPFLEL